MPDHTSKASGMQRTALVMLNSAKSTRSSLLPNVQHSTSDYLGMLYYNIKAAARAFVRPFPLAHNVINSCLSTRKELMAEAALLFTCWVGFGWTYRNVAFPQYVPVITAGIHHYQHKFTLLPGCLLYSVPKDVLQQLLWSDQTQVLFHVAPVYTLHL